MIGTIRLLRDFDNKLLKQIPCLTLETDDGRLVDLNAETKRRWEAGETIWE